LVGKYPQICNLFGKIRRGFGIVGPADAEQNKHAGLDFGGQPAVHADASTGNTLDDGAQDRPPTARF
jgi:hypothetical protein